MKKAQKMANVANGVIYKSCNKVMIEKKTFWKNHAISRKGILHGANVMTLTDSEITKLQTIKNGVYRRILGPLHMLQIVHQQEKLDLLS